MKPIKKFKTFEELKADEKQAADNSLSLKKHNAFEQFVKSVRAPWAINDHSK
ncbi:hypothetical protein ACVW0P_001803 [Mucilaginibacter sp. UYNi724]